MDPTVIEGTIEPGRLATIDPAKRLEVFTTPGGLNSVIEVITSVARKHKPDVTTDKGRKAIASNAYQVAKCKVLLDDAGKEETAKAKEIPNKIDAARRDMRARLEDLQAEVRKPLTDWEAEQERIEAEKRAAEEAAALARQIEADHEIALTLNWAYDQKRREELEALERDQQAREEEIAREAAEKERLAAAQREADLKAATEKAEREKAEAEQRTRDAEAKAEQDRIDAEARAAQAKIDADKQAEQAAIEAQQAERNRQAAAKKADDDAAAATEIEILRARVAELEASLTKSTQALDDWTSTFASEFCDEARVKAAWERIMSGGGTLYYIASIVSINHNLLKK